MNIFIQIRTNHQQWGGDLTAIRSLEHGLKELGIDVTLGSNLEESLGYSHVFLTNTCTDKRADADFLNRKSKQYAMLTFHEDFLHYFSSATGFAKCVEALLKGEQLGGLPFTLKRLADNPTLPSYFGLPPARNGILNCDVLRDALISFPTSRFEESTIRRDSPDAKTKVWHSPTGLVHEWSGAGQSDFAALCGLKSQYVLQVGRLETRKNQLATILAGADLPIELVFVSTKGYQPWYEKLAVEAIIKYRKYPTIIVSENIPSQQIGLLKIVQMPGGQKLSNDMLHSAYTGAIVNCHPAFYELPGLTYLESIHCEVQTICSRWTSVAEYISNDGAGSGIHYVDPRSISEIKNALLASVFDRRSVTAAVLNVTPKRYAEQVVGSLLQCG
jgi:glycosyltransferase involved in cell wall biosynthesis